VRVTVNGAGRELHDGATVADVAALLGVRPGEPGVAVALDDAVVPGSDWTTTRVPHGASVEIVRATAGG
jgi:sulfur carrier protein